MWQVKTLHDCCVGLLFFTALVKEFSPEHSSHEHVEQFADTSRSVSHTQQLTGTRHVTGRLAAFCSA